MCWQLKTFNLRSTSFWQSKTPFFLQYRTLFVYQIGYLGLPLIRCDYINVASKSQVCGTALHDIPGHPEPAYSMGCHSAGVGYKIVFMLNLAETEIYGPYFLLLKVFTASKGSNFIYFIYPNHKKMPKTIGI